MRDLSMRGSDRICVEFKDSVTLQAKDLGPHQASQYSSPGLPLSACGLDTGCGYPGCAAVDQRTSYDEPVCFLLFSRTDGTSAGGLPRSPESCPPHSSSAEWFSGRHSSHPGAKDTSPPQHSAQWPAEDSPLPYLPFKQPLSHNTLQRTPHSRHNEAKRNETNDPTRQCLSPKAHPDARLPLPSCPPLSEKTHTRHRTNRRGGT